MELNYPSLDRQVTIRLQDAVEAVMETTAKFRRFYPLDEDVLAQIMTFSGFQLPSYPPFIFGRFTMTTQAMLANPRTSTTSSTGMMKNRFIQKLEFVEELD